MDRSTFYAYLLSMRTVAVMAECARDAIRAAEERLTRVSCAGMDGVRVSTGGTRYDAMAMRIHDLQQVRKSRGRDLSEAVRQLRRFRAELDASGLGDDECAALWLKYVRGQSAKDIARTLGMQPRHVGPMLRAAREALADSMGAAMSTTGAARARQ